MWMGVKGGVIWWWCLFCIVGGCICLFCFCMLVVFEEVGIEWENVIDIVFDCIVEVIVVVDMVVCVMIEGIELLYLEIIDYGGVLLEVGM